MLTMAERNQMIGWGYTKAEIDAIELEDIIVADEARFNADYDTNEGDDDDE